MPRDIPVGNGRLLVCFDANYSIRDVYFPHVGQENHLSGGFCRLGVWTEGQFSWVGPQWKRELRYVADTLVTQVHLYHEGLGLLHLRSGKRESARSELAAAIELYRFMGMSFWLPNAESALIKVADPAISRMRV